MPVMSLLLQDVDLVVYQFNLSDIAENPTVASEENRRTLQEARQRQGTLRWWKFYDRSALFHFVVKWSGALNYYVGGRDLKLDDWKHSPVRGEIMAR